MIEAKYAEGELVRVIHMGSNWDGMTGTIEAKCFGYPTFKNTWNYFVNFGSSNVAIACEIMLKRGGVSGGVADPPEPP